MSDGTLRSEWIELLGDVVAHRHRWGIDHPDPLGVSAWYPEQAAERELLRRRDPRCVASPAD